MNEIHVSKSFQIPMETWKKLRQHALKHNKTQGQIIRKALQEYLKNPTFPREYRNQPLKTVSRVFHIPLKLAYKLQQTAKQEGVAQAYLLRQALKQYFEGE